MKKLIVLLFLFPLILIGQNKTIETDIFTVIYCEEYQQPLFIRYTVECPFGEQGRSGITWTKYEGVLTSDKDDYINNIWDRGHLAPAADFSCNKETIRKTFTYLNCALQHEGLNRGPWKELERFERDLAKVYFPDHVKVEIEVLFQNKEHWLPSGALVPSGFRKKIITPQNTWLLEFPNEDVSGKDWSNFIILK